MKSNKNRHRHKINGDVRYPQVRLVGFYDEPKVISSYEAAKLAESEGLDLILINESQNPPVVKIEDYKKFLYNLEKLEKEKKRNSLKSVTKEVQLSPEISDNDLKTKIKKSIEFLKDGNKIKCVLQLKGRQRATPERGEITMLKYAKGLEEFGTPENLPSLESGRWLMIVKPTSKK